jgi:hypothetical protein
MLRSFLKTEKHGSDIFVVDAFHGLLGAIEKDENGEYLFRSDEIGTPLSIDDLIQLTSLINSLNSFTQSFPDKCPFDDKELRPNIRLVKS